LYPAIYLKLQTLSRDRLPEVVELDRLCFGGLWTIEGYQRELDSPNSELLVISRIKELVGDENEENISSETTIGIGCLWAILEEAHITIIGIHPDYRGMGLGKLMLCELLKKAVSRQLERATLEVRDGNNIAIEMYEKFGFKVAGRRKKYYQVTGEDALILWRGDLAKESFQQDLAVWQQRIKEKLAKFKLDFLENP
jgi:[ribosomal protein S18]-alanine N-acetyltransferase